MPNPYHLNVEDVSEGADYNALERPSVMERFRERVNNFWDQYRELERRHREVPDGLKSEYDDVTHRGRRIRATIEQITNSYDAVAEWISDVFGFSGNDMGLDGIFWSDVPKGNLGAIQFVPLALIAGASALIAKWLKDAYTLNRKLDEVKRLEGEGYNPERAAEIANKTISGPGLFSMNMNWKPLAIVGVLGVGLWYANRKGWI